MKDNITPEEKLLRILEGPAPEKKKRQLGIKGRVTTVKRFGAWLKGLRIDKSSLKQIDLQVFNKMLTFLCAFFTFFCIFDFTRVDNLLKNRLNQIKKDAMLSPGGISNTTFSETDIKKVLARTRKRNIFTFLSPSVETIQTTSATDMVKNLKLVGILWSENPQVMIEDTKQSKTYLLSIGEVIGELQIKRILKDKVVVGKDDVEWEIR